MSKSKHRVSENELAETIGMNDHPLNFGRRAVQQPQSTISSRSNVLSIPEPEAPFRKEVRHQQPEQGAPKHYEPQGLDTRIGLSLSRDQKRYIDDAAQVLQSMRMTKEFRHTNNTFLRCIINVVKERLQFAEGDIANNAEEAEALIRKRLFDE